VSRLGLTDVECEEGDRRAAGALDGGEPRQERESAPARSGGIYPPPHAMFACAAARWHSAMPEGGCRSSAKRRTQRHDRAASAVVEEETRHILARKPLLHIGEAPRTCTLNLGANPAASTSRTQPGLTASSEMLSIS
jgi:hypothetical protein